jgi:L-alanine-DL-glutamate epimerase-like enolase superfamily enzyme
MDMRLHEFALPLRHTFRTARGAVDVQRTLVVELEQDGLHGYGEATTNAYYGASIANMSAALEAIRPLIASRELDDPAALWDELAPRLQRHRFAQCALDQAVHDLWGKLRGQPVYRLWGLGTDHLPVTSYTIGIDTIDAMVAKLLEVPGWPIYKIKLGTRHDLEIVRELRAHTDATFRVDANCGWDVDETLRQCRALRDLNVEFIEQPLAADRWDAMRRVFGECALPLFADESCGVESDVERCHGRFHGVNIKLVKCGGLTPARRMIARARQLGMQVMVGCMTESSVGISAIAQLLPLVQHVDIDGALLLAEDIATGVTIDRGVCRFADENGCGVRLRR